VPDPLDALRTPITPMAPDPAFAARLRRRLELLVTTTEEEDQMTDVLLRDRLSRNGTRHGDVSYITLALPDAAKGRRFYGQVLGWTFGAGRFDAEGNQVDAVIPQVGLWPGSQWRQGVGPGAICSWRVDDISAAVEAVRAAGGTADEPAERPYGLEAECTDGQGLRFWLHQLPTPGLPADPSGDRQGDVSYVVLAVADLERAEAFFSSVLGWSFSQGHAGLNVQGPVPMTGMSQGEPGVVLCYRVDDLAAAVERVGGAGGRPGDIEQRPYGLESRCVDDQGVEFYLHQF
jgi:predicted enzyme related to lactoylglutathione lyase